jgi:hypothetical protein
MRPAGQTLRDRSRRPRSCPHETSAEIVGKIIYLRQNYYFGPAKIAIYLKRYHDIQISDSGVWRILKRLGMNRSRPRSATSPRTGGGSAMSCLVFPGWRRERQSRSGAGSDSELVAGRPGSPGCAADGLGDDLGVGHGSAGIIGPGLHDAGRPAGPPPDEQVEVGKEPAGELKLTINLGRHRSSTSPGTSPGCCSVQLIGGCDSGRVVSV